MAHALDLKQLHDLSRLNKAGRKFMVRFFYLDTVIAGSVLRPLNFSQAVAAGCIRLRLVFLMSVPSFPLRSDRILVQHLCPR